ncbi:MAG: DUF1549 domain-containing protein [Fuerstiella sp.]
MKHVFALVIAFVISVPFRLQLSASEPDLDIRILPEKLVLDGLKTQHQLLLEKFADGSAVGMFLDNVEWLSQDPKVALVEAGMVVAVSDGATEVRAIHEGRMIARIPVNVSNSQRRFQYSFRNHVQAVLAKQGCNMGACHGALAGKGGFRLSLRGYDTERDFYNISQQHLGRRVDLAKPALSLLLTKPTLAVPHKGGLKLPADSKHYQVVSEWIADGAMAPSEDDPVLLSLSIFPDRVTVKKDQQQQFLIQAHYSDQRTEDVTQWARFNSSNEAVATVTSAGVAEVVGPGEGAVTAWFGSRIVTARITSPFQQSIDEEVFAKVDRSNFIDDLICDQLQQLNLAPSPMCSDEVFVRRVFLDTIGVLPTAEETGEFLADSAADKRVQLVDRLLQRSEFVDYWSYHWSDLLMLNGALLRPEAVKAYYEWIAERVEKNVPWDHFVREIVTAKGGSFENGATNFYALHQTPEDMAENVSQAFLGLSIGCAKCHNHPLEKWTNDQYYAFANLFSRVRAKGWGGDSRNGDGKRTLVTVSSGELIQPRTGKAQAPAALDQPAIGYADPTDRRQHLADWLVSKKNGLFARSITNRVWSKYMGVGLVEEVDDMRASNPASNEKLLAALSDYLTENDFNLKALMRQILISQAYQRSSQPLPQNKDDNRYYSRYYPRRLMAEVMLDAVSSVTAVSTTFNKIEFPGADIRDTDFYPAGTRAIQLYDSAVRSYFLKTFGRNQRRITCECERSDEPSMVQVLHLSNGDTINSKLAVKDNRLQQLLDAYPEDAVSLLEELFLSGLSRQPSQQEQAELSKLLNAAEGDQKRELLEDIAWGMMSSREFLFNH